MSCTRMPGPIVNWIISVKPRGCYFSDTWMRWRKERADEAELRGQEYLDIPEPSWSYTPLGLSSSAIFMCMPSLHLAELIQTINGSGHSEKDKSARTNKYLGSLGRIL